MLSRNSSIETGPDRLFGTYQKVMTLIYHTLKICKVTFDTYVMD